jgi:uncharacterized protein (DUF2062 family)
MACVLYMSHSRYWHPVMAPMLTGIYSLALLSESHKQILVPMNERERERERERESTHPR